MNNTVTLFVPSGDHLVEVKRYKNHNRWVYRWLVKHTDNYPVIYIRMEGQLHVPWHEGLLPAWDILMTDKDTHLPYWHLLDSIQVGCLPELLESQ